MKLILFLSAMVMAGRIIAQSPNTLVKPEIIRPSQQKKPETGALGISPLQSRLNSLGLLTADLLAYFPMDDTANGCLGWSRKPLKVVASGDVQIKNDGFRKYADFTQKGARLVFDPPFDLGRPYTLAAWVLAPAPQKHGVIWHGSGALMVILPNELQYWVASTNKAGIYARTGTPLNGWVHVAVTYDGNKTQAFLNGIELDAVKGAVTSNLTTIGNHPSAEHQHWMMANGIDEQFIFGRALNANEIKRLMQFSQPKL